jgi:hypothetical protein
MSRKKAAQERKAQRKLYLQEQKAVVQIFDAKNDSSDFCLDCMDHLRGLIGSEPLGVAIFRHNTEDEPHFRVWLTATVTDPSGESVEGKIIAIGWPTACEMQARFHANSIRAFLDTPQGQRQTAEYAMHLLGSHDQSDEEPSERAFAVN